MGAWAKPLTKRGKYWRPSVYVKTIRLLKVLRADKYRDKLFGELRKQKHAYNMFCAVHYISILLLSPIANHADDDANDICCSSICLQ